MVNNHSLAGVRTNARLLFILGLLLILLQKGHSQSISKYYNCLHQTNGSLYYLLPQKGFFDKKNQCHLTYDITYVTSLDSARVNISLYHPNIINIDSILFSLGNNMQGCRMQKLFIQPKGNAWEYRYSLVMPFNQLQVFFAQTVPPVITIEHDKNKIALISSKSSWKKQSSIISRILQTIELNRH